MKQLLLLVCAISMTIGLFAVSMWDNPVQITSNANVNWNRCGTETNDNCMIYVWSDSHSGGRKIYAQKVDLNGNTQWSNPALLDTTAYAQQTPVITRTTNNDYIIAYTQYQNNGSELLKAQKINSDGQILWTNTGKSISSQSTYYSNYKIVADNVGGAYIFWIGYRNSATNLYGQRVNSAGQTSWGTNGLPLVFLNSYSINYSLVSDNNGGLLLGTGTASENLSWVSLSRIQSNGMVLWTRNMQCSGTFRDGYPNVTSSGDNSALIFWIGDEPEGQCIKGQRYSLDGSALWENPVFVVSDSLIQPFSAGFDKLRVTGSSDDGVIVTWQGYMNSTEYPNIYTQKIDVNGNRMWTDTGVVVSIGSGYTGELRLTPDSGGGCYIVWDKEDSAQNGSWNIYTQHITGNGIPDWQTNGIPVCTSINAQHEPIVRVVNSKIIIGWEDMRNGSNGIYFQILNPDGTNVLETNGRQFFWSSGSYASTEGTMILPRPNGVAVIWAELRNANSGYCPYFQFINADGTIMLEQYGRALTDSLNTHGYDYSVVVTPTGQLCFVWTGNDNRIKAQLIDESGNRLWGNNGMFITETGNIYRKNPKISYDNGAFYISWVQLEEIQTVQGVQLLYRIYGQKIINNQTQWGPDGLLVSQPTGSEQTFYCELLGIKGRYFIWLGNSTDQATSSLTNIYVKLLSPDGTTASGWSEAGIATFDYAGFDCYPHNAQANLTDAGLFVCWTDYRIDYLKSLYGQLISPQGQLLWNPIGVELSSSDMEVTDYNILPGNEMIVAWTEKLNSNSDIYIQKYSATGSSVWADNPVSISPSSGFFSRSNPVLAQFDNGGMVAVWNHTLIENNTDAGVEDIYYRYITPQGVPIYHVWGRTLANKPDREFGQSVCVSGNDAYVMWFDSDNYQENAQMRDDIYESYSIFAQKLSNEYVGIDDETYTPAVISLEQNYPNPFNPTTNISFNLKGSSDATLTIYNQKGQKVRTLHNGLLEKGRHDFTWNGKDDNNKQVASGIYMYRLTSENTNLTKKMVLLK